MKILITAGPTREPIDAVRYIANRSSGQMGAALASATLAAGHSVTLIVGPVTATMPLVSRRIDVETSSQMLAAVMDEFPRHDALIMAAAVADYRPKYVSQEKLARQNTLTIECEATEDIVAEAGRAKRPDQVVVGFSLELQGGLARAREKLALKNLNLIVFNPGETINSPTVQATLVWPDGRDEPLPRLSKTDFAATLIEKIAAMYPSI
jgi:phosphopantothenoylcysteine decarboxylase/phosphopantothenate--cysteine ligase